MGLYKIADLYAQIDVRYPRCSTQLEKYRVNEEGIVPDIKYYVTQEMIDAYVESGKDSEIIKDWPQHVIWDEVEYMLAGQIFYRQLLRFNGMLVHSSAIVKNNKAYLFSGKSGVGKSTHTGLWLKEFGDEVYILNEDKPAVRKIDGKYYTYGTPWSGKTNTNVNRKAELECIVFLGQAEENAIRKVDAKEAFTSLFEQTDRKADGRYMIALMDMMEEIVKDIPIYHLDCNISREAVRLAHDTIVK